MRFDYTCHGTAKYQQASVLIGLKKVLDSTPTPGLGAFFNTVCGSSKHSSAALDFASIPALAPFQFAKSSDFALLSADGTGTTSSGPCSTTTGKCFNNAAIFTWLYGNNHLPLFPVTASEWAALQAMIPAPPLVTTVVTTGGSTGGPCDTTPVTHTHINYQAEYANIEVDRMCLVFEGLAGAAAREARCCKYCTCKEELTPTTTTSTPPKELYCFDCVWDEIMYAILATLIVWRLCNCCFGGYVTGTWYELDFAKEGLRPSEDLDRGYSPMIASVRPMVTSSADAPWRQSFCRVGICTLIVTVAVYLLINIVDYLLTVKVFKKELCIKIFDFEKSAYDGKVNGDGCLFGLFGFYDNRSYANIVVDAVCWERLLGLMCVTWLSIWWVYLYQLCFESRGMKEVTVIETEYSAAGGAAAGGGGGGGAIGTVI
jgi:hypothetical protein